MPANTISPDLNCNNAPNSGLEDQRALQLALELTMLGLNSPESELDCNEYDVNDEMNKKRSQNMTECVPVPSSEHVAEIVGRQGCKIKALRAKTNTYIKTPVRGEEPVFVVTGRKEDVGDAKREILSAAEHFSQIRASRRNNNHGATVNGLCPPSPNSPGQVTLQVRVPYRVVGLVVGPKGATIKRIQQLTHTYIVTPSRDKEPVFEVTGKAEHVEKARIEIEKHIAMRTGGLLLENGVTPDDIESNGFEIMNGDIQMANNEQLQTRMNSAYYNAMNNMNMNSNLLARQNLIMQDYSNLNASKRDPFHDVSTFNSSDLVYDPYSLLSRYSRPDEDLLGSQCWSQAQTGAQWPDQQRMQVYNKMAQQTPQRRNSLESSPHLSPNSDQSMPTHATIRRISSDPVSGSEAAQAWNSFQTLEFGPGFQNGLPDSPPVQDVN